MEKNELSLGFSMTLAQNPEAMQKFALMSESEKRQVIERTHSIGSRAEMHRFVSSLGAGSAIGTKTDTE